MCTPGQCLWPLILPFGPDSALCQEKLVTDYRVGKLNLQWIIFLSCWAPTTELAHGN